MVILQLFDLETFFDKEMIEDGILTCSNIDANPKAIRWAQLLKWELVLG